MIISYTIKIMPDCLFCKIINKEIPSYIVYEDDDFLAFLDIKPINLGHTLIVPKKHYRNIFDWDENINKKIGGVIQKISSTIKTATEADGINIGINNEPAAGQIIFHSHIHIIPRFNNDGLTHWPGKDLGDEDFKKIENKLKGGFTLPS